MASRPPSTTKGFHDPRYRRLIEALIERRRELGLSQETLGRQLGMHQQFVSRYELGERRLDAIEFADVAMSLGLNAPELLTSTLTK